MKTSILQRMGLFAVTFMAATAASGVEKTITLTSSEHIADLITEAEAPDITSLTVITTDGTGPNYEDLLTTADLEFINLKLTGVKTVDLREASVLGTIDSRGLNQNPLMPAWGANQTIEVLYLPNNVKNIAGGCLTGAVVREVYLPASVNGGGNVLNRFNNNPNLEKIDFYQPHAGMKSVDGVVYTSDGSVLILYPSGIRTADVVLPEGMKKFQGAASMAFNPYIKTISLPSTFETISNGREMGALSGQPEVNASLSYISIPESNPTYGSLQGMLYNKGTKEIVVCPPAYAQEELTIDGDKIIAIRSAIFGNNQNIKRVTFTEGFTTLDNMVFKGAGALEYVELPASLNFVGNECFHGCGNLRVIISRNPVAPSLNVRNATTMGNVNFRGLPLDAVVGVPAGAVNAYRNSFWNRNYTEAPYTVNGGQGFDVSQFVEYRSVEVEGGKAASDVAVPNSLVPIEASRPASDDEAFVRWTSEPEVAFVNAAAKKTSFTMPDTDVKIKAVFSGKRSYTMVNAITLSGTAAVGSRVEIVAPSTMKGKPFDKWVVVKGNVELENPLAVQTSFVMPDEDVEIEATFATLYMLTVIDGSATVDGEPVLDVAPGRTVTITADELKDKSFSKWSTETEGVTFADAEASITTFVMPAADVTVTAEYRMSGVENVAVDAQNGPWSIVSLTGLVLRQVQTGPVSTEGLAPGIYVLTTAAGNRTIAVK